MIDFGSCHTYCKVEEKKFSGGIPQDLFNDEFLPTVHKSLKCGNRKVLQTLQQKCIQKLSSALVHTKVVNCNSESNSRKIQKRKQYFTIARVNKTRGAVLSQA